MDEKLDNKYFNTSKKKYSTSRKSWKYTKKQKEEEMLEDDN